MTKNRPFTVKHLLLFVLPIFSLLSIYFFYCNDFRFSLSPIKKEYLAAALPNGANNSTSLTDDKDKTSAKQAAHNNISQKLSTSDQWLHEKLTRVLAHNYTEGDIIGIKEIIEIIGPYASNEISFLMKNLIFDSAIDPDVRASSVSTVNWDDSPLDLLNVLRNDSNPSIMTAAIFAAERTQMDPEIREEFNNAVFDIIEKESDGRVITAALNYLSNEDPKWLSAIQTFFLINPPVSTDVVDYIQQITQNSLTVLD